MCLLVTITSGVWLGGIEKLHQELSINVYHDLIRLPLPLLVTIKDWPRANTQKTTRHKTFMTVYVGTFTHTMCV